MSNTPNSPSPIEEADFVISRVFDAPRELVYKAWTEAERLAKWWGPKGMKVNITSLDFSPGGTLLYSMETPDGNSMWGKFVYREVTPPTRIIFVSSFSDAEANVTRAPFSEEFPLEVLSTVTFSEEAEGKTRLELRATPLNATPAEVEFYKGMKSSMQGGWTGTLNQLAEFLTAN